MPGLSLSMSPSISAAGLFGRNNITLELDLVLSITLKEYLRGGEFHKAWKGLEGLGHKTSPFWPLQPLSEGLAWPKVASGG